MQQWQSKLEAAVAPAVLQVGLTLGLGFKV
jgi:hypothetical protein